MTDTKVTNFRKNPQYKKQMKHLAELITEGQTGKGKFVVLGVEAGVGKSRETDRAIARYLSNLEQWDRKFLLVKRFKEDVHESVKTINQLCPNHYVAIGITEEEWKDFLNKKNFSLIQSSQVVVITHARYRSLSQKSNEYFRTFFEADRHTLIVDEQIEIPAFAFTDNTYGEMIGILTRHNQDVIDKVCKPLHDELDRLEKEKKNNHLLKANPIMVDNALIKELERRVSKQKIRSKKDRNKVNEFIDFLYNLGNTICLYNPADGWSEARLRGLCLELDRWTLENNIILDANAGIDKRFDYAADMSLDVQPRFVQHNNFTFNHVKFNSSKANKLLTADFYPKIAKLIKERQGPKDKTFVVTHEYDEKTVIKHLKKNGFKIDSDRMGRNIAVAHFGEIIGKNTWKDFNQVWVIASPNIPMEVYPLHWSLFAQQPITEENLLLRRPDGSFGFREQKFEDIRIGCLVSEIYQAVKRINRDMKKQSQIYVATHDEEVVTRVRNQLKNVTVGETIDPGVKPKDNKKKEEQPKRRGRRSNRVPEMRNLILNDLEPGEHQKKDLYNRLGWEVNGQTGRIWGKPEITELQEPLGLISIETRFIIKHAS